jgi:hypothetical protein
MLAWIPEKPAETAAILGRLNPQNQGLGTGIWQVYNHTSSSLKGVKLVLGGDDTSVVVLKTWNFKPFCNMQRAALMVSRGMKQVGGKPKPPS